MTEQESVCRASARSPRGRRASAELKVPAELLDQLVKGPMTPGRGGGDLPVAEEGGHRTGDGRRDEPAPGLSRRARPSRTARATTATATSGKTVLTDDGPVRIEVPRDRDGSFEPQLIAKHERRFTGFDQKIVAMYARGMTVREIQGYLRRDVRHGGLAGLHQQGHR